MVQNLLKTSDFDSVLDNYFGKQMTHIPVTKTTSNTSQKETLTKGSPVTIKAYLQKHGQTWNFEKMGKLEEGDAVALCKYADDVDVDDLICSDGTGFTVSAIDGTATTISATTSEVHGLSAGDEIIINGTSNYDGIYTVATVPTTKTLTIADTSHNLAAETSGALVTNYVKYRVKDKMHVTGTFDSTGQDSDYVYTACSLFLADDDLP